MTEVVAPRGLRGVSWKAELLLIGAVYAVYTLTRNLFGSARIVAGGVPHEAFRNAEVVIRAEQALGLYVEPTVQSWFVDLRWFMQALNAFYGLAHFVVTIGVLAVLFVRRPDVYPRWRTAIVATTCVAIVGYALFPLMPPRLLDAPCPDVSSAVAEFGGRCIESELRSPGPDGIVAGTWAAPFTADDSFGYVDTLAHIGGPWSFQSDALASISNQYAAMPSLHIAWAMWCAIAVWPLCRRLVAYVLAAAYPVATLFAIVATGNHFWLDAVGGLLVLAVGLLVARLARRHPRPGPDPAVPFAR